MATYPLSLQRMLVLLAACLIAAGCGSSGSGADPVDSSVGQDGRSDGSPGGTTDADPNATPDATVASDAQGPTTDAIPLGGVASGATVYYVGKITDVTDYSAATGLDLGRYGYYFPQFGQSTPKTERPARDNMQFMKPAWQRDWEFNVFERCGGEFCNVFSPDAGVFDIGAGQEGIGVFSKSEGNAWASIKFTGGSGNSGSVVDPSAKGNSNNSVNHIRIGPGAPAEFCMSILTDNTAGAHDILGALTARIGWYQDVDLEAGSVKVPSSDLVYNGVPDLYVFKFANMTGEDFIKIRLNGGSNKPGFGGLMFDPCD